MGWFTVAWLLHVYKAGTSRGQSSVCKQRRYKYIYLMGSIRAFFKSSLDNKYIAWPLVVLSPRRCQSHSQQPDTAEEKPGLQRKYHIRASSMLLYSTLLPALCWPKFCLTARISLRKVFLIQQKLQALSRANVLQWHFHYQLITHGHKSFLLLSSCGEIRNLATPSQEGMSFRTRR